MNDAQFGKLVEYVKKNLITEVLLKKGAEYSRGNDRLSNFKRMAEIQGCTPEKALIGAWSKHLASILDMVDDLDGPVQSKTSKSHLAQWDEKIGDAINYLILLRALIEERK